MSEKRKDSRGRSLKTGESQRANGQYYINWVGNYRKLYDIIKSSGF